MDELERRSAEIRSAELDEREIEILVAPYDDEAELGAGVRERYGRGVFGTPEARISLKLETGHGHAGPTIGRSIGFEDTPAGLVGRFKISRTRDGDDALELARDGALGSSAGFIPRDVDRDGSRRIIRSAELREVTLTPVGAYQRADVLAVRSQAPEEETVTEHDNELAPEERATDRADAVAEAVTRALDEYRAGVASAEVERRSAGGLEVGQHRGHEYRRFGELVGDVIAHARRTDPAASERLTRSIDEGLVNTSGTEIELRAFSGVGNSVGDSTPNNVYLPDLLTLLREGRPVANLFAARALPDEGNTVQTPSTTVGNTVGYQDGEGTALSETVQSWILKDWKKATIGGGQGITLQAMAWSSPGYMEEVTRDLVAAYGEFVDLKAITGDPATDTPASGTGYTGILNAGATDVPVGGDAAAAVALLGSGWAAVYQGSRRAPIAAMMDSATWGEFLNAVDTDGRPIVSNESPSNPAGLGDAASVAGVLRGLPVVVDENIPSGNVILGSFRDALLFEDQQTPARLTLTYPSTLTVDLSVYGFSALAIRRPEAFAVLSGITVA